MKPEAGLAACQNALTRRAVRSESDLKVFIVPMAGHFPFLDQPALWDEALAAALRPYLRVPPAPDVVPQVAEGDVLVELRATGDEKGVEFGWRGKGEDVEPVG
jgi:hypothetical protein